LKTWLEFAGVVLLIEQIIWLWRVGAIQTKKSVIILVTGVLVVLTINLVIAPTSFWIVFVVLNALLLGTYVELIRSTGSWLIATGVLYVQVLSWLTIVDVGYDFFDLIMQTPVLDDLQTFISYFFTVLVLQTIVLVFLYRFERKFSILKNIYFTQKFRFISLIFLVSLIYLLWIHSRAIGVLFLEGYFATTVGIAILTVLLWYLIIKIEFQSNQEIKLQIIQDNYLRKINQFEKTDKFRHDYKGILIGLNGFLENNDLNGAKKLIADLIGDTKDIWTEDKLSQIRIVNDMILESLLLDFLSKCDNYQVNVHFNLSSINSPIRIRRVDFARSISIILTNAFEAIQDIPQAQRDIKISVKNTNQFELIVENPFKDNGKKVGHTGYGLENINQIVSNYKNVSFDMTFSKGEAIAQLKIEV
jgi:two-component system, LytTR family, sensor histidine kinase AgrC